MTTAFNHPDVAVLRQYNPEASEYLRDMLFGDKLEKREKWFKLFDSHPMFRPKYLMSLDESRELAYKRIKAVADAKLFSIFDFVNDPINLFTAHEMLG